MLKRRLIPKLLIKHRQIGTIVRPVLVTTQRYEQVREVGDPISQAKIYESNLADELIILNIDGEPIAGDTIMLSVIERLASETFMPLAVGGGVRTVDDFGLMLDHGADKVTINRMAVEQPDIIRAAAGRYGAQCVLVAIDYRTRNGVAEVFIDHAARATGLGVVAFARRVAELGAGEILLTDADRDGTGSGIDIATLRQVTDAVQIPVIASGGCGLAAHFTEALAEGRAEGVAAGTFFCFRDQNPMQARAHISTAGISNSIGDLMRVEATPEWSNDAVQLFLLTPEAVSDDYIGWLADPLVNRYLESRYRPQPRHAVEQFVADMLASETSLFLGIRSRALDAHVGNIKLGPIDLHHGLGEIGIMIGDRAAWGRGIGSAAIRALEAIARETLGLRKLTAGCYASNLGSKVAFEKAGFVVEGHRRDHYLLDGRPEDGILLGKIIARSEVG